MKSKTWENGRKIDHIKEFYQIKEMENAKGAKQSQIRIK